MVLAPGPAHRVTKVWIVLHDWYHIERPILPSATPMSKRPPGRSPAPDAFTRACLDVVAEFRARRPLRAGSLLVTVFGDAIAVHGGTVWLGSLIGALDQFGVNERLVRTSVFRLAKDGWLASEQIGRRSYYRLTEEGRRRFDEASRRIYGPPRPDWSGSWCTILLASVDATAREAVRKELRWLGFGAFSANLMAHPSPDMDVVYDHLASLNCADELLIMHARSDEKSGASLRAHVHRAFALEELGERYDAFLATFRPIYRGGRQLGDIAPAAAFQVRTLLIHEFRKILLRDPLLPASLLPRDWPGAAAYQLCRNLYGLIADPAEQYLTASMETADGPLPPADPAFYQRFGGLPSAPDTDVA